MSSASLNQKKTTNLSLKQASERVAQTFFSALFQPSGANQMVSRSHQQHLIKWMRMRVRAELSWGRGREKKNIPNRKAQTKKPVQARNLVRITPLFCQSSPKMLRKKDYSWGLGLIGLIKNPRKEEVSVLYRGVPSFPCDPVVSRSIPKTTASGVLVFFVLLLQCVL